MQKAPEMGTIGNMRLIIVNRLIKYSYLGFMKHWLIDK